MESKHNVFNMTIVQVLTQQVERVNAFESEIKAREQLLTKAEVDLNSTKEALEKEKESLKEKEKALDEFITSQKQKTMEEAMIVEELQLTKGLLRKAHKELQTKSDELNAELNKVKVSKVSEVKEVSNIKLEKNEAIMKEKKRKSPANISIK